MLESTAAPQRTGDNFIVLIYLNSNLNSNRLSCQGSQEYFDFSDVDFSHQGCTISSCNPDSRHLMHRIAKRRCSIIITSEIGDETVGCVSDCFVSDSAYLSKDSLNWLTFKLHSIASNQRMFQVLSVVHCVKLVFQFQPLKQRATTIEHCGKDGVLKLK